MKQPISTRLSHGFTLIELMIVVAIVAILAVIALPAYQSYVKRARFTEVIAATGPAKTAIDICVQISGPDCTAAGNSAVSSGVVTDYVASVSVAATDNKDGPWTITATATNELDDKDFILEGEKEDGRVKWANDSISSCIAANLC